MEYLGGGFLADRLKDGPLPAPCVPMIVAQLSAVVYGRIGR